MAESTFQYKRAKTSYPSSSARYDLKHKNIENNGPTSSPIWNEKNEQFENPNRQFTSNFVPSRNATEIPDVAASSCTRNLDGEPTMSIFSQNCLHSLDGRLDALYASPVKPTLSHPENPFPSHSPNLSFEIEIQDLPKAQLIALTRKVNSSNRERPVFISKKV